jgi:outer membrane protein assembly factor BamB
MGMGWRGLIGILTAAVVLCGLGIWPAHAAAAFGIPPSTSPRSWTVYHGNSAGTGVASGGDSVDTASRAWTSPSLDGQLYGEPLVYGGLVYVATENDTVYALSTASGAVDWSTHLGTPVSASSLPCGNISPTVGITGTPVIDPSRNEIFVVADVVTAGHPAHTLVGLNITSGKVELRQGADPPGANPAALLQRTGLALDAGQVVFGMGGNYGDCGTYRGRVAAVPEAGGSPRFFTVDSAAGESQGAIWMGGAAPVIDGHGNIWVVSGNGSVDDSSHAYDYGVAALELSSSLRLEQYFTPADWASRNQSDLDMSAAPVLLPSGQVLVADKSGTAYLLNGSHLGGIGGEQAKLNACEGAIDGGGAMLGMTVFLPCLAGITAVQVTAAPPGLRLLWSSGFGSGPPLVAGGLVWSIGRDDVLYGLDQGTGKIRQQVTVGASANDFPTPSVADGLMLAACAVNVVAFRVQGSAGSQPPASSPEASCQAYAPPGPGIPRRYLAAAALGGLIVVLALAFLAWFILRRRTRRPVA